MIAQPIKEGLTLIFQGIKRLHEAFPSRAFTIDGRLVGDIGEVIAELEYDLTLDEVSVPDHDAQMRNGRRVQITEAIRPCTPPGAFGARHWSMRSTSTRHRIRHGIRHTAARVGRRFRPYVANGRLRHRLIGNARVSKVDGSQSLDLQSGVSFLWTPVQLLTASTLHRRTRSTPCQAHGYS